MLLWLSILLFFIVLFIPFIKKKYMEKIKNKKHYDFFDNSVSFVMGISVLIILLACLNISLISYAVDAQINAEANNQKNIQTYNSILYKLKNESLKDEFGITNKKFIDEVQSWNEKYIYYSTKRKNKLIYIFYPDVYKNTYLIDIDLMQTKKGE